jgi:putative SOS response-associated peptidase YedK
MLVVVLADEYDAWLTCQEPEVAQSFFRLYPADKMVSIPAPKTYTPRTS